MKPLKWKSEPTVIGWSDVMRTLNETSVTPSNPGPADTGVNQFTLSVAAGWTDTLLRVVGM